MNGRRIDSGIFKCVNENSNAEKLTGTENEGMAFGSSNRNLKILRDAEIARV